MSRANINDAKCVLVVGATAGIGRALALAILYTTFHQSPPLLCPEGVENDWTSYARQASVLKLRQWILRLVGMFSSCT